MIPVTLQQQPALLRREQGTPAAAAAAAAAAEPNGPLCIPPRLGAPMQCYARGFNPQTALASPQAVSRVGGPLAAERNTQKAALGASLYSSQQKHMQQQHPQLKQQHMQPQYMQQQLGFTAMLSRFPNITPCSAAESASLSRNCSRIYRLVPPQTPANLRTGPPASFLGGPTSQRPEAAGPLHQQQRTIAATGAAAAPQAAQEVLPATSVPSAASWRQRAAVFDASKQQWQLGAAPLQLQQQQQLGLSLQEDQQQQEQDLLKLQHLQQQQHLEELRMQQEQNKQQLLEMQRQQQQQQLRGLYLQQQQELDLQQQELDLQQQRQQQDRQLLLHSAQLDVFSTTQQQQQQAEVQQQLQREDQQQQYAMQQHHQGEYQQHELLLLQQQQQDHAHSDDATEQQQRLTAELQLVEQKLADKEALLALFEGASEQQQQLRRGLQLQQLQRQQQQLQQQQQQHEQLLELIEQQKQELAKQQQAVDAKQREVEDGVLLLQQQQEALKAQQQQQQAAAEAQQKQQQWLEEQQAAFRKAQSELAAERRQQQQQQEQLTMMQENLHKQEAELADKRKRHQQQQQLLLQQQANMQASLRAQGVQLLQQHQALQRQLQQQRELQQQILDHQRQQLVETQDALQQQQQQQQNQRQPPFNDPSVGRRVTREAGLEPMLQHVQQQLLQQQRQQQQLQEELLQHLKQQNSLESSSQEARWCYCDVKSSQPSVKGPNSKGAPIEEQRGSADSTRLPSAESAVELRGPGEFGSSSRGPQRGLSRNHSKALLKEPHRGPVKGPHAVHSRRPSDEAAPTGATQGGPSTGAMQAKRRGALEGAPRNTSLGGPVKGAAPGAQGRGGTSTCPPRLLRSTESQRLREESLQKHLKALNEGKRSGGPREGPKRGPSEHSRLPSAESEYSNPSRSISKSNSWRGPQHTARGALYQGDPREPVHEEARRANPQGAPLNPQGTRLQQQKLQQLLEEQRREINLLMLEKQQLERAATAGGGGLGGPLTPKGPTRPLAFPKEPYVQNPANCGEADGGPRGCVCGGDHPRTAWGPLDAALAEVHNSNEGLQRWTKVNEGVYFYGDTQVSLSFINGRLMAQTDGGPSSWNKGARGDILKFIRAADERRAQANA